MILVHWSTNKTGSVVIHASKHAQWIMPLFGSLVVGGVWPWVLNCTRKGARKKCAKLFPSSEFACGFLLLLGARSILVCVVCRGCFAPGSLLFFLWLCSWCSPRTTPTHRPQDNPSLRPPPPPPPIFGLALCHHRDGLRHRRSFDLLFDVHLLLSLCGHSPRRSMRARTRPPPPTRPHTRSPMDAAASSAPGGALIGCPPPRYVLMQVLLPPSPSSFFALSQGPWPWGSMAPHTPMPLPSTHAHASTHPFPCHPTDCCLVSSSLQHSTKDQA